MTTPKAPLTPLMRRIVLADAVFEFVVAVSLSGVVGNAYFWLNVDHGITVAGAVVFAAVGAGLAAAAFFPKTNQGFLQVLAFANIAGGLAIWLAAALKWSQFEPGGHWLVAFVADGCLALGVLEWLALRRGA